MEQGRSAAEGARAEADILAVAGWLARHHGRAFTETSLKERLPRDFWQEGPEAVCRALDAIGLKSRLVERKPERIDPGSVPVVLFATDGRPLVLMAFVENGRAATI